MRMTSLLIINSLICLSSTIENISIQSLNKIDGSHIQKANVTQGNINIKNNSVIRDSLFSIENSLESSSIKNSKYPRVK